MCRPKTFLLLVCMLLALAAFSQHGFVFVKKGIKKKEKYSIGDPILLRLKDGSVYAGYLNTLQGDTMIIGGRPIPKTDVKDVLLKRKPKKPFPDTKTVLLIAAGSVMTSTALVLTEKRYKGEALIAGPVIGFGPLLLKHFGSRIIRVIPRGKYRMGKKFYLQVLDMDVRH